MLGRLKFSQGGRGKMESAGLYGLPVLQTRVDPDGWLSRWSMERAARTMHKAGVIRTLLPQDFEDEMWLRRWGFRRVDCAAFLQAQSPALAEAALRQRDIDPKRACVKLRGERAGESMFRCAAQLCNRVRYLSVDVSRGGEELASWLRWEFGVVVLPVGEPTQLSLCFQQVCSEHEETELELYGHRPRLGGLRLWVPAFEEEEQENLELMSVLWERGKLGEEELKFT